LEFTFLRLPKTKNKKLKLSSAPAQDRTRLFQDGRALDNISYLDRRELIQYPGWSPTKTALLGALLRTLAAMSEGTLGRKNRCRETVSGQPVPTPVAGCMRILILPTYPCRSYHVTCDGCTKACLLGTTLSQPLKPRQQRGDGKVPKRLNRIPYPRSLIVQFDTRILRANFEPTRRTSLTCFFSPLLSFDNATGSLKPSCQPNGANHDTQPMGDFTIVRGS
jgi:hypothetical protein